MVTLSGVCSDVPTVYDGVPQGSVLGPTLFLCYINYLVSCEFEGGVSLYADDTAIYYSCENIIELERVMNNNLAKLLLWTNSNRLSRDLSRPSTIIRASCSKLTD